MTNNDLVKYEESSSSEASNFPESEEKSEPILFSIGMRYYHFIIFMLLNNKTLQSRYPRYGAKVDRS